MRQYTQNNLGFEVLPIIMKELVTLVMRKKTLPLEDAFYYIYSSDLYQTLLNEEDKAWYMSSLSLYDLLEKEKTEKRKKKDHAKILLFNVFCLEHYKVKQDLSAEETLFLFSKHDIFAFLRETYEMLHTQDEDYILDSIYKRIKIKKSKR